MEELGPQDWKELARSGSRVFIGSGAGCPNGLLRTLAESRARLHDVQLIQLLRLRDHLNPQTGADDETFQYNSFGLGGGMLTAFQEGRADYTPCYVSEIPQLFRERAIPLDLALVSVTPPDELGRCSLGTNADIAVAAVESARRVVVQINDRMPRTWGHSPIMLEEVSHVFEESEELPELLWEEPGPVVRQIAENVAKLIEDGDTLHLERHEICEAVLQCLDDRKDLGLHTELLSDGMMRLIRKGVITDEKKALHRGLSVASMVLGSRRLYQFVAEATERLAIKPTEEINNPLLIARNPGMVSITTATRVDLTGLAGSVRGSNGLEFSLSSQLDFMRGAAFSDGGRPIIALPSLAADGSSNIVPQLATVTGGVATRADTRFVVTEHGIARLWGRTMRERVLEMIRIAHPDHQEELLRFARERHAIREFQTTGPSRVPELDESQQKRIDLKDGSYLLRPLRPADERTLQEFFYSHTPETVQFRYGYMVASMSRRRAQELVSVRQDQDLALGIFSRESSGIRETLRAVGRYYLDTGGKSAEVAFVVSETKRNVGMAGALLGEMIRIARARGLEYLWAQVEKGNRPMVRVFEKFQAKVKRTSDCTEIRIDL
jgi:acyl-CoA hydrolase/GNAT superfamily N-acetyltransferase